MQREGTRRGRLRPSPGWRRTAILFLTFVLAVPCSSLGQTESVTLAWDPNSETYLAGYRLHYGRSSGNYTDYVDIDKSLTTATVDLPDRNTYYFALTAFDLNRNHSGYSNEVAYVPEPETVSKPLPPSGPTSLQAGVSYVYTAEGARSSTGDAVQYRFLWSDGTDSDWLPAGTVQANKSWGIPATYTDVRVEARCAVHPLVVSDLSDPISVTVEEAPAETVSQPMAPAGPTTIADLGPHAFTTGGALSSAGHELEYRFLWADGTDSPWLPAGQVEASRTWSLPGIYGVRSEARCALHPTVHSTPSPTLEVRVEAATGEDIGAPSLPAGPTEGLTGLGYAYTTGSATSTIGDPLEYRFQWGDGTASAWLAPGGDGTVTARKFWGAAGVYSVVAEARCAVHPSVPAASGAGAVSITRNVLLFADPFTDGTAAGDPQWRVLSGEWKVRPDKTFASVSRAAVNRAIVKALPSFRAGRLSTKVRLTPGALQRGTGIVFSLADTRRYRYVLVRGSRIFIGQEGDTARVKAGVKASAARRFRANRWHALRVDIHPGGRVSVFLGKETKPALTYRFADVPAGRVGLLAHRSEAHFDDFRAWDARALR